MIRLKDNKSIICSFQKHATQIVWHNEKLTCLALMRYVVQQCLDFYYLTPHHRYSLNGWWIFKECKHYLWFGIIYIAGCSGAKRWLGKNLTFVVQSPSIISWELGWRLRRRNMCTHFACGSGLCTSHVWWRSLDLWEQGDQTINIWWLDKKLSHMPVWFDNAIWQIFASGGMKKYGWKKINHIQSIKHKDKIHLCEINSLFVALQ